MRRPIPIQRSVSAVLLTLLSGAALAQVQRAGGDSGSMRLQQQIQQLGSEKAQAEAQLTKLKQDNDSLKKQVQQLTSTQAALKQRGAALETAAQRAADATRDSNAASDKLRAQLQELIARYRDLAQNLKGVETDRTTVRQTLAAREQSLKDCRDRNQKLYTLNADILTQMEHGGFWSAVGQHEPFTRIGRTRLENLVDTTREQADELHLPEQTAPLPGPAAPEAGKPAAPAPAPRQ